MLQEFIIQELESVVGSAHVLMSREERWCYAYDATDLELTKTLIQACRGLNLTVHDHLIISRQGYFSLAEQNML